ncbi:MAG: DUF4159 domain-containing protein [Anaerolineae bacterium]|nr:DUF4159 domain-containing protein [Phycisphaerae bacterium]
MAPRNGEQARRLHKCKSVEARALVVVVLIALSVFGSTSRAANPRDVDAAINDAVKYLYSQQQDGKWEREFDKHGDQSTGQTALAVHALLSAGESHQDERIVKAIDYLKKTPSTGVYALALRCQVWSQLPPSPEVRAAMAKDVKILLGSIDREGRVKGFYGYNPGTKTYSLSRGHYAALGVWAAAQAGYEVPNNYWQLVEKGWIDEQDPSGGWSYKGKSYQPTGDNQKYPVTPGMTADGIATLFITQDYLHADEAVTPRGNIKNPYIDKALDWMSANFKMVANDEKFSRDYPYATLYAIERIGAASGLKYFDKIDWYEIGADRLMRNRKNNGSWTGDYGAVVNTSFAILFLAQGRAPIVMNKLEYDIGDKPGNWNQRPRDVANITRWIGKQSERDLNWQIVNLNAPVEELHDSPILYIAGNQELKFTKEESEKLRQFIEAGGLILGNAEANSIAFTKSFKQLAKDLLPNYELRQLPADHAIFTNQQFPAEKWKRKPTILGVSNGAREMMLLAPDVDLSRAWQVQETGSKIELFQLAANIFLYSVDKKEVQTKGQTYQVAIDQRIKPKQFIAVARLKFPGNWDPEPGGWRRISAILNNRDRVAVKVSTVDLTKEKLDNISDVAHLSGVGKLRLTDASRAAIKKFVDGGGTLIVDAAGGNAEFAQSAEAELNAIFGTDAEQLKNPLPPNHPIYQVNGRKLEDISYRMFARQKLVGELKGPRLRGITLNGRLAVIYSPEDLTVGMVGQPIDGIIGYSPSTATELMRYILLNSLNPGASPTTQKSAATTKSSK